MRVAVRTNRGIPAASPQELIDAVHDNMRNLGLDALDVVNFRMMGEGHGMSDDSLAEQITTLAELKAQGLVRHIGVSNVTHQQVLEAQSITDIVCVQNMYNVAHRNDDALIDALNADGIAYVPFFPIGRIHAVAVIGAGCRCDTVGRYTNAGCASVVVAAFAQHSAHSRHVVGGRICTRISRRPRCSCRPMQSLR